MVREDANGELNLFLEGSFTRRQDAPIFYDMTAAAYVIHPDFVMEHHLDGRVKGVVVPSKLYQLRHRYSFRSGDCTLFSERLQKEEVSLNIFSNMEQKTVLITGAAGRLGTVFAKSIVASGYRAFMVDLDLEKGGQLLAELGPKQAGLFIS